MAIWKKSCRFLREELKCQNLLLENLRPLAYQAEDKGVKIYRLNIGQPDLPTPQKALDILKNIDRKILEYSPSQGYGYCGKRLWVIMSVIRLSSMQMKSSLLQAARRRYFSLL